MTSCHILLPRGGEKAPLKFQQGGESVTVAHIYRSDMRGFVLFNCLLDEQSD